MAPNIFLTGATGYIGGSVLHTIVTAHPEYNVTVLLRKTPPTFASTYPNVTVVTGDYDSAELLSHEASKADIVIHCGNSDHIPSLNALLSGLLTRPTPGYIIHLSGTGLLSDWSTPSSLGTLSPTIYSDTTSLAHIRSLPDAALHRATEKILHETAAAHADKIRIAIMCPPDIYGRGSGPGNTQSVFVQLFVRDVLRSDAARRRAFYYRDGTNARSWVHVKDLVALYLRLVEAAAEKKVGVPWNAEGYYFAGTQEHSQMDVAVGVGRVLKKMGRIAEEEPVEVGLEAMDGMAKHPQFPSLGRYLYASNSRTRAERAREVFGWEGKEKGLMECLEDDVEEALTGL